MGTAENKDVLVSVGLLLRNSVGLHVFLRRTESFSCCGCNHLGPEMMQEGLYW